MMYIKLINGVPEIYSIGQLRRDNPQVSFPKELPDSILEEYDVFPVTEHPKPNVNPQTHYLIQSEFYQVDGRWQLHYTTELLPKSQVAETVRQKRDQLLAETDWIVVRSTENNYPVPIEWINYRQALRDITLHPNFPYEVEWPIKPE